MLMSDLIQLIVNNGIGVVCVGYMIYFQLTTMKEMNRTMNEVATSLKLMNQDIEDTLGFPEAVQIAVSVNGKNFLVFAKCENCFGRFTRLQLLPLISFCCLQCNPLDIMSRQHRMLNSTDRNIYFVFFYFKDRNMFFNRCIGRSGNDLFHFLPTADNRNA